MGGGIAVLMLGTILAWMLGCIPCYALITVVRSSLFWPMRVLLAVFLSALAVILLWWTSIAYRTPWIFGGYTLHMAIANVVAVVLLIVRFFMRRG